MNSWPHQLFSEGELSVFLADRLECFRGEMEAIKRVSGRTEIHGILERYRLKTPVLLADSKILEHGHVDVPPTPEQIDADLHVKVRSEDFASHGDHLDAKIAHLETRLKAASPLRTFIIIEFPFEGDGELLRFRPPGCTGANPQGVVYGQAIRMKYGRAGKDDRAWTDAYRSDQQTIDAFLAAASAAVNSFNAQLHNNILV